MRSVRRRRMRRVRKREKFLDESQKDQLWLGSSTKVGEGEKTTSVMGIYRRRRFDYFDCIM